MSEYITIARPYAKAIFDIAKNSNSLESVDSFFKLFGKCC